MLLEAKADFIRTRDTQLLYSRSWIYRSEEHAFLDLGTDDGRRLRREVLGGIEATAHKIVYDLFISKKPESPPVTGYPVGLPVTVFTWTPKGS